MKSTNACPEKYRNLTATHECQLRGIRLGTLEKPGGVPHMPNFGIAPNRMAEHRALIQAALTIAPQGFHDLRRAVGIGAERLSDVLSRMKSDGLVKRGPRYGDRWEIVGG